MISAQTAREFVLKGCSGCLPCSLLSRCEDKVHDALCYGLSTTAVWVPPDESIEAVRSTVFTLRGLGYKADMRRKATEEVIDGVQVITYTYFIDLDWLDQPPSKGLDHEQPPRAPNTLALFR